MHKILLPLVALALTGCEHTTMTSEPESAAPVAMAAPDASARLATVLAAQPAETRERYGYRHPDQTLAFFGIEPGMTIVEALPGGGWYSKILIDYVGNYGLLIGADYAQDMFPLFGFFNEEFIEKKKTWVADWTAGAQEWRTPASAPVTAFVFGSMPSQYEGKADAVLFIRALHNLNRFENKGSFMTTALDNAHRALKPGGILGVVQHQAPDSAADDWADGSKGYLKKAALIARLEAAGFEFVAESAINENPNDQPGEADIVWRLPPTLVTSRENPQLREQMRAVGESNRMTLKFRKPN